MPAEAGRQQAARGGQLEQLRHTALIWEWGPGSGRFSLQLLWDGTEWLCTVAARCMYGWGMAGAGRRVGVVLHLFGCVDDLLWAGATNFDGTADSVGQAAAVGLVAVGGQMLLRGWRQPQSLSLMRAWAGWAGGAVARHEPLGWMAAARRAGSACRQAARPAGGTGIDARAHGMPQSWNAIALSSFNMKTTGQAPCLKLAVTSGQHPSALIPKPHCDQQRMHKSHFEIYLDELGKARRRAQS